MTIGIPKALIYWKEPGIEFWKTFFKGIGLDVIISPSTNRKIVAQGAKASDTESCFSSKVFLGHVLELEDKVDYIFIPRMIRNEMGLEYCPKFFALSDIATLIVKTPIIFPRIDFKKESLEKIALRIGKQFCDDIEKIKKAIDKGKKEMKKQEEKKLQSFYKKMKSNRKKIVLVSHPYILYDEYANLGIEKKLNDLGMELIHIDEIPLKQNRLLKSKTGFIEKLTYDEIATKDSEFPNWHWEFGRDITEQVEKIIKISLLAKQDKVNNNNSETESSALSLLKLAGAIEISAFQCGCDSVLKEFVEKMFKQEKIPFLYLLIDEHTAEAGLQTRLEAFVDTIH
ncbi:MAG: acyl-CoA dehydratase activase-related protein [Patescibacteria group bacterium]|nr:acyl-CoA dehydratase activase-related protein [Patescibacteria group bacterium]